MHNYLPTSLLHLNMKWKRWSCWWGDSAAAARFKEKEENREERGKKTFPLFSYVAVTSNICKSRQKKNVKWWPQAKLLDSSLRWYAILRLYLCSHLAFVEFIVNYLTSFTFIIWGRNFMWAMKTLELSKIGCVIIGNFMHKVVLFTLMQKAVSVQIGLYIHFLTLPLDKPQTGNLLWLVW